MANGLPIRLSTLPSVASAGGARGVRLFAFWAGGAAAAGAAIGFAIETLISVLTGSPFDGWFVRQSVLFGEAVALSALVASRYVLPSLAALSAALRYSVVLAALVGGSVAVTALSLLLRPGVVFARPIAFLSLIAANIVLALVVGGALIAWDRLKASLAGAYDELREKDAFVRELELAREVQRGLLPERAPRIDGWEIAFRCRMAALVGGDMLDFVPLDRGRLGLSVGDVSGKGIAAALLMANVQALSRVVASLEDDPARLNAILSDAVHTRAVGGRYVTFAYAVLDPKDGAVRCSLAGHHPPIVAGPRGARLLEQGGVPLGMFAGAAYESAQDVLAPGETMVLYTDGLIEAPAAGDDDEQFGRERLTDVALRCRGRAAEELADAILEALDLHTGGAAPADDTTLVVVRRAPRADAPARVAEESR